MATNNATTGTDNIVQPRQLATDTLVISSNSNQIQATDVFDGGAGTDTILISGAAGVAVRPSADRLPFKNYEGLSFNNTTGTSSVTLSASQIWCRTWGSFRSH